MDIGGLIQEMDLLYRQAQAQLAHKGHLASSQQGWRAMQTGLQQAGDLLLRSAGEVAPEWADEAGEAYTMRMRRSAAAVRDWHAALASADIPGALSTLASAIDTRVAEVSRIKQEFDQQVAALAAVPNGPGALAAVEKIIARLRALVAQARQELLALDQAFTDAAQRVSGAPGGTAWDGPAGDGGPATMAAAPGGAAPGGAAAGGAAAGGAAGGAGGAGGAAAGGAAGGAAGAGAVPGPAGGGPGLAGVGAPAPPTLPPGGLSPTIPPVAPPPGPSVPPLLPPVAPVGAAGGALARRYGGAVPPVAGTTIPRASRPVTGAAPLAAAPPPAPPAPSGSAGGTTGTSTNTVPGRIVPPMMMSGLAAAAGAGTGTGPKPGTPDRAGGGHRNRPLRAVPGVPPRLRGRAGTLAGTPAFLAGGQRPTNRREENPARDPGQLLDEELWQVEAAPAAVTEGRRVSR